MTPSVDGDEGQDASASPHRRRRRVLVPVAAVALCAMAAIAVWVTWPDGAPSAAPGPSGFASPSKTAQSPRPTASAPSAGTTVQSGAPVHVRLDAVGLDAEVLPTASVGGAFDPPTLREAYWIEAFGAPGTASDNTVYLIGHSWDDGDAVFNPLFDRAAQTSEVAPGDLIVVSTSDGDVTYRVDRTERVDKDEIAQESNEVWDVVPGRLLLITCFQNNAGGATLDNFVVFADIVA